MSDREGLVVDLSIRISARPSAVGVCRRLVRSLEPCLGECTDNAVLVASEIITNAIRHGSTSCDQIEVDLAVTDELFEMRVRDCGPPFSLSDDVPEPGRTGGFGLPIAARTAQTLEIRRHDDGNEVRIVIVLDARKATMA